MSADSWPGAGSRHELNNVFCKILGAAELALDHPCAPAVREELQTIMALAEIGGALVAATSPSPPAT